MPGRACGELVGVLVADVERAARADAELGRARGSRPSGVRLAAPRGRPSRRSASGRPPRARSCRLRSQFADDGELEAEPPAAARALRPTPGSSVEVHRPTYTGANSADVELGVEGVEEHAGAARVAACEALSSWPVGRRAARSARPRPAKPVSDRAPALALDVRAPRARGQLRERDRRA